MNPSYYINIPASVRYDKALRDKAILLYGEITALTNKEGYCWASNEYFSELYCVSQETISRLISQLKNRGHIVVDVDHKNNNKRKITLSEAFNSSCQKRQELLTKTSRPIDKNVNTSIYSINNTINTDGSALNFLINNYQIRFEQEFLMPLEKEFKSQKHFDTFLKDFNDESEMKEKVFGAWLVPMLKKYARKWIDYQNRLKVIKNETETITRANQHLNAAI